MARAAGLLTILKNMSRRSKANRPRLILPGASKLEWQIKNYLHINNIAVGKNDMQTLIINSFCYKHGLKSDAPWKEKLLVCNENFGRFAQFSQTYRQIFK